MPECFMESYMKNKSAVCISCIWMRWFLHEDGSQKYNNTNHSLTGQNEPLTIEEREVVNDL
jgi:hypothetical protein